MDLRQLKELGAVIPAEPIKKTIVWVHPVDGKPVTHTFDVFIKPLAAGIVENMFKLSDTDRSRNAELICGSVGFGPEGNEFLTYEEAFQLETSLAKTLALAIREVNEMGKQIRQPETKSSGTNSSSAGLAAVPSRKRKPA